MHMRAVPVACLIGLIWGSTNPFIRRGSLAVEAAQQQDGSSSAKAWFIPALCLPWLCNQLGSVLFVVLLGQVDISMAVPVANAISIAANALVSLCTPRRLSMRPTAASPMSQCVPCSCPCRAQVDLLLGERYSLKLLLPGCVLVGAGVLLCTQ